MCCDPAHIKSHVTLRSAFSLLPAALRCCCEPWCLSPDRAELDISSCFAASGPGHQHLTVTCIAPACVVQSCHCITNTSIVSLSTKSLPAWCAAASGDGSRLRCQHAGSQLQLRGFHVPLLRHQLSGVPSRLFPLVLGHASVSHCLSCCGALWRAPPRSERKQYCMPLRACVCASSRPSERRCAAPCQTQNGGGSQLRSDRLRAALSTSGNVVLCTVLPGPRSWLLCSCMQHASP